MAKVDPFLHSNWHELHHHLSCSKVYPLLLYLGKTLWRTGEIDARNLNLFIISGVAATVFLGGWAPINIGVKAFDTVMDYIPGVVWFMGKAFFIVWLLMWVKWTFPRLRIDQILKLEWKYLMPLSLINIVLMTLVVAFRLHW